MSQENKIVKEIENGKVIRETTIEEFTAEYIIEETENLKKSLRPFDERWQLLRNLMGEISSTLKEFYNDWDIYIKNYKAYLKFIEEVIIEKYTEEFYKLPVVYPLSILKFYIEAYKVKENIETLSQAEKNRLIKFIDDYFAKGEAKRFEVLPELENYHHTLQGPALNKLITTKTANIEQLGFLGEVVIEVDKNFKVIIEDYEELKKGIPTTAYFLLRAFLIHFTETEQDIRIKLPLRKYAEMRGLKDLKGLRKQVIEDMEALQKIKYECKEKIKGKWIDSGSISIYGGTGHIKNSIIHFNFNVDFYNQLKNYPIMEYSKETLKINPQNNPYAFHLSEYIDLNYRLNEGKERVNIISTKTLISKVPKLPTYEEVMQSDRAYRRRIIKPVIRDLNSIEHLYYDLINEQGKIITNTEDLNWEEFINSSIKVDYSDYPQHPERLKKKRKHNQKALKK